MYEIGDNLGCFVLSFEMGHNGYLAIHFSSNNIQTRIELHKKALLFTLIMSNDNIDAYVSDASDCEEETASTASGILPYQFEPLDHSSHNEAMPENSHTPDKTSTDNAQMKVGICGYCTLR